jgi:hypothetical protein
MHARQLWHLVPMVVQQWKHLTEAAGMGYRHPVRCRLRIGGIGSVCVSTSVMFDLYARDTGDANVRYAEQLDYVSSFLRTGGSLTKSRFEEKREVSVSMLFKTAYSGSVYNGN